MKPIDLEEGGKASRTKTADGEALDFNTLPGRWNVLGDNSTKNGIMVLGGGGGDPAFVCPYDKTWNWDSTGYRESDNGLVVRVTGQSGYVVSGTMNWWSGDDGQFWNYIWNWNSSATPAANIFIGTDLSAYYNKIPKGEKSFSLDLSTMKATLSNGETPEVLIPGTYKFSGGSSITVPDGCFALQFHLHNMMPQTKWYGKDIDRFFLCPLEYVIIFERTGDL